MVLCNSFYKVWSFWGGMSGDLRGSVALCDLPDLPLDVLADLCVRYDLQIHDRVRLRSDKEYVEMVTGTSCLNSSKGALFYEVLIPHLK